MYFHEFLFNSSPKNSETFNLFLLGENIFFNIYSMSTLLLVLFALPTFLIYGIGMTFLFNIFSPSLLLP